ncbi:hypothetical protein AcW1_001340 [Taiwanofungus camphoratus]|nr:hypothetical protein AcW2_000128 [Antrodia cinnamomea]KAI0937335.1 hypothetical protein AcV5_005266 [Antrodia cinnamomea]KAI0962549.1 hypothetical protein AcV7_001368 [Antrodia cinnamomea]KAI0964547.1 hypothetical protein AcW1_001340 [Antrodia cinnamomea]
MAGSRSVASSSSHTAPLHTSANLQASAFRKRKSRVAEKANVDKRREREQLALNNRPHIILGTRPGDEVRWQNCDLARIIITEENILSAPIPPATVSDGENVQTPTFCNYGMGEKEKRMLFEILPALTTEGMIAPQQEGEQRYELDSLRRADLKQEQKAAMMARLVDLRNANAGGIAYENRRRIVAEFSEPENPTDPGRPEVQAALLTMRIRALWGHLSKFKKDISNRRSLRRLVHQRAKVLRYLKRVDRDRYDRILERLALEPQSVEGELVV